jgi:predicted nucleic acid-binding protein
LATNQAEQEGAKGIGGEASTQGCGQENEETKTIMMIETDMLYAHVKSDDWLKPTAEKLMQRIAHGDFGTVSTSREVLHELYYVSMEEGLDLESYIARLVALTSIPNLKYLDTTSEIDILAATLMKQFNLASIFDAYFAATALNADPDHTIISTDEIFDKVTGIKRRDPRTL